MKWILWIVTLACLVGCAKSTPSNETAQSNIHRYVHGKPLQIEMINCNDESPTDDNHVYCTAWVRNEIEGNRFEVHLKCDQTRMEGYKYKTRHESTGCVLNTPP